MSKGALQRFGWGPIIVCWLLAVLSLYVPLLTHAGGVLPFTDNDDVMRMVTATDLADGQGWQDKLEHRDNAPYGTPMHWSRLVDAPIAGLLLLLRPELGAHATVIVPLVLPPVLLLLLLAASVGLTRRLLGPGHDLAAALLPVLSIVVLGEFSPGRIDHHNWQMILTTALVWATISGRTRPIAAIVAGGLAATSLAIGIETLPFIVGSIVAFSLFWVRDPAAAGNARRFALALAAGTALHFVAATAPAFYFTAACDELSVTYVVAIGLVAVAMVGATLLGRGLAAPQRLLVMTLFGGLAAGVTLMLFPECRAGPYGALDARAFNLLLTHVPEAQPFWNRFLADPADILPYLTAPLAGLVILGPCCSVTRGERRLDWLVLALFLLLATLVALLQIRGARLAVMPAMPVGVWLIAQASQAYRNRRGALRALGLVASWALFASIVQALVPMVVSGGSAKANSPVAATGSSACYEPGAYRALAALPRGSVLSPMQIGAEVLRYTRNSVVSAGYHRNPVGALDVEDFFSASESVARRIAWKRNLTYVVACRGMAQLRADPKAPADSFVALYAQDRHWPWLEPLSAAGDRLQIYRVLK
jgi:hypothetical protein